MLYTYYTVAKHCKYNTVREAEKYDSFEAHAIQHVYERVEVPVNDSDTRGGGYN